MTLTKVEIDQGSLVLLRERVTELEAIIESMRAEKASCEKENSHLRQELARLTESANRDRDILNIVVEAVGRRGRE